MKQPQSLHHVVCPFCALHCDDLTVISDDSTLTPDAAACQRSINGFGQASKTIRQPAQPLSNAQPVSFDQAVAQAAQLFEQADFATIVAAADVDGSRAAVELAERCGGVIEHPDSDSLSRNLSILQSEGWLTTSLSEARNRADLFVIFGERIFELYPRLPERVLKPPQMLFEHIRETIVIGPFDTPPTAIADATVIHSDKNAWGTVAGILRSLLHDKPLHRPGDNTAGELIQLAAKLRSAVYPVIVWAAREFAYPHAELALQNLFGLIRQLSEHNRCVALPLAGDNGAIGAVQVNSWCSGFPLRTAFNHGYPEFDPYHYDYRRLLNEGETDLLVWLDVFPDNRKPPSTAIPSVVLGPPGISFDQPPTVYIPVGLPAIDHPAQLFRSDSVALPTRALRPTSLPTAASVLRQIIEQLP